MLSENNSVILPGNTANLRLTIAGFSAIKTLCAGFDIFALTSLLQRKARAVPV